MNRDQNMLPLENEVLDVVTGGAAKPGSVMVCTANAPLYEGNPAGSNYRSTAVPKDTVPAGMTVKLYEYGAKYSKVIANGNIGWIETAFLASK